MRDAAIQEKPLTIWVYTFIRLAAVAYQICKIPRNSPKIRSYSSSSSPKVIDLDAN